MQQNLFNRYHLSIDVKEMNDKNKSKLITRLKALGFSLSLNQTRGHILRVFVFNFREDKVDSPATFKWLFTNKAIVSGCL